MVKPIKFYSSPHLVHIETTYACNSRCIFCYNPQRCSSINYEKLDKVIGAVRKAHIPHVYLIGGEPSLLKVKKLNEYINSLSEVSSVTVVTNGKKYMGGLSKKIACLGIPIHGNEKIHNYLTNCRGGYRKTIPNIERYVKQGFDVRCIPVLMSINHNQIYNIIKLAAELGMESVFIDRFESGGLGSKMTKKLSPTLKQFRIALGQMIKAKKDFGIPVGFGTAIPYCIDKRLIEEGLQSDCGVGVWFAAINPDGDVRICNQSQIVYGNVLKEPLEKIWNKEGLANFRNLEWVDTPCKECKLLYECICSCKVDSNCPGEFCIDYAIRGKKNPPNKIELKKEKIKLSIPENLRRFKRNPYLKLNDYHKEDYMVTRYQTVEIDRLVKEVIIFILKKDIILEKELLKKFADKIPKNEIRKLLSKFEIIGAIDRI